MMGRAFSQGGHGSRYTIIYAYTAREFFFGFLVCFLFFFAIFFVNQFLLMAGNILARRAPLGQVLLLLIYATPSVLAMSFPFAALVGALMAVGRMSSDNELLALMAAGVSSRKMFIPFLVLGIAISTVSFVMNDYFMPLGNIEFGKLYRRLLASSPALELKPWSIRSYRDVTLVTGEAEGAYLKNVLLFDRGVDGSSRVICAGRASLVQELSGDITLKLENVWEHLVKYDKTDRFEWANAASMEYRLATEKIDEIVASMGPSTMASVNLLRTIREKEKINNDKLALREADAIAARATLADAYDLEAASDTPWVNALGRMDSQLAALKSLSAPPDPDRVIQVYRLEFYKKFAIPAGALCFMVIAFPLGLRAKRSGRALGFVLGLLISVLYWALLIIGNSVGGRFSFSPFLSIWAANILVVVVGFVLVLLGQRRA